MLDKQIEDKLVYIIRQGEQNDASPEEQQAALVATAELFRALQPLIRNITLFYTRHGHASHGLVQSGNAGLLLALRHFDINKARVKGYKFSTYSTWWIRAAIHNKLGIHK